MYSRECAATPPAPYMVPMIQGDGVRNRFPKVAVDVFVDKSAAAQIIPRVLRSRVLMALRAAGLEPVDLQSGITQDLPILSLIVSAPGVHAVLTYPAERGERSCVWRMHRNTAHIEGGRTRTPKELTLETTRDFARAYRRAAGLR